MNLAGVCPEPLRPMSELDQYDYDLPRQLIAQSPCVSRADARMLVVDRRKGSLSHHHIRDLAEFLQSGDCLALNDTQVVPARLLGRRARTGGHWEGLFLQATPEGLWRVLGKTRGHLTPGEEIVLFNAAGTSDISLRLAAKQADGSWIVRAGFGRGRLRAAGAGGPGAPAAVHPQRRDGRVGPTALPDGLCAESGSGGRPHGGTALHRGLAPATGGTRRNASAE